MNFLLAISDDQRWDTVGLEHSLDGITPTMPKLMSKLASSAIGFSNAFVQGPVCGASRASILTGLYAHNHGVLTNYDPYGEWTFQAKESETLPIWLQRAGFRTGLFGKYINGYQKALFQNPVGWNAWKAFNANPNYYNYDLVEGSQIKHYGSAPADYSTYKLCKMAQDFITADSSPFFAVFAPYSPHNPAVAPNAHLGHFDSLPNWNPPNYNEADVSGKPKWVRDLVLMDVTLQQRIQDTRREQLATNLAMDDSIGTLIDLLIATGKLDDTCVIYLSDNGFSWGEHRHIAKYAAYEESIRATLYIRYSPLTGTGGIITPAMASNLDLAATICEIAGASMGIAQNGVSLVPVLQGGAAVRQDLLIEHTKPEGYPLPRLDPPTYNAVRTVDGLKYVEYEDQAQGNELYDLVADPYELANQIDNAAYGSSKAALQARLVELKAE